MRSYVALLAALSAALMFSLQLLMGRRLLPLFGGAPAVWLTALLFFQALLFLGYLYAHGLSRLRLGVGVLVHAVLLAAAVALPLRQPESLFDNPWLGLLSLLLVGCGLPFFALSASATLLQYWFQRARRGQDPYWIYAASNLGSAAGLLCYPLLIEPQLSLQSQAWSWRVGFAGVALGLVVLGLWVSRVDQDGPGLEAETERSGAAARWCWLSMIGALLLYGVTSFLTVDIAPLPLIWAWPLLLYLGGFAWAFGEGRGWLMSVRPWAGPAALILLVLSLPNLPWPSSWRLWVLLLGSLSFGLLAALVHGLLVELRPGAGGLTRFYLVLSLGGLCGGVLGALLVPLLFRSLLELPLAVILAALLLGDRSDKGPAERRFELLGFGVLLSLLLTALSAAMFLANALAFGLGLGLVVLVGRSFGVSATRQVCAGLIWLGFCGLALGPLMGLRESRRSFFGIHRVVYNKRFDGHLLLHGTTVHGCQRIAPELRAEPLTYYHRGGPVGQFFQALPQHRAEVGVLGLGVGSLAAYGREGEHWSFFELDATVAELARDRRYFDFLERSAARCEVLLGDARIKLAEQADGRFDLLVLDTFSSDAIPTHLLTRQAFELYLKKLKPGGLLLFHISNRYLRLEPLVTALARERGWSVRVGLQAELSEAARASGAVPSHWVALAAKPEALGPLRSHAKWRAPKGPAVEPWTDDFAALWSVLKWGD